MVEGGDAPGLGEVASGIEETPGQGQRTGRISKGTRVFSGAAAQRAERQVERREKKVCLIVTTLLLWYVQLVVVESHPTHIGWVVVEEPRRLIAMYDCYYDSTPLKFVY